MPKFLEDRLKAEAAKKGKRADEYVYGAMNDMGAMHGDKETAKGRAMERLYQPRLLAAVETHDCRKVDHACPFSSRKNWIALPGTLILLPMMGRY